MSHDIQPLPPSQEDMTDDGVDYHPDDLIDRAEFDCTAASWTAPRHQVTIFIWSRTSRGRISMPDIVEDHLVDVRELMCPMSVMAAPRARRLLQPHQIRKILATDDGALSDIPAWAEANGEDRDVYLFYVRKADQQ
jgi:tRNA 2-thiouridine synthesizing protein A